MVGPASGGGQFIEVVIDEAPLRQAMYRFSRNLLLVSLGIAMLTAGLVYLALHYLFVRPLNRLTTNMVSFRQDPENASLIVRPSGPLPTRSALRSASSARCSAISHQCCSRRAIWRRSASRCPRSTTTCVTCSRRRSFSPTGLPACGPTRCSVSHRSWCSRWSARSRSASPLSPTARWRGRRRPTGEVSAARRPWSRTCARRSGSRPSPGCAGSHPSSADSWSTLTPNSSSVSFSISRAMHCRRSKAARRNEPGRDQLRITGRREGTVVAIEISDTGPGVPERAREHLFEAFQGSTRRGGSGLGLAIAAELVRAHGGEIRLVEGNIGATFRISIPGPPGRYRRPARRAGPRLRALAIVTDDPIAIPRSARAFGPTAGKTAPVAQLDRAPDYESGGQEFESLRARHFATTPEQ